MKYVSEDLMIEHEGILLGLTVLKKMADMVRESGSVDTNDISELIGFLRLFADKCHHGKEEGLLFPAMEKAGIPVERGPVGQMLLEHNEGRKYLADMELSVERGALEETRFVQAAESYVGLMKAHIGKENTILFPLGNKAIPLEEQEHLLKRFESFEEEIIGKGTHEKMHELLFELESKYLTAK